MNINIARDEIEHLCIALQGSPTKFTYKVRSPSEPFRVWWNTWEQTLFGGESVSAPEVTSSYGIYLLATVDTEVIYVGKATPRDLSARSSKNASGYHLGAEICSKMRTARLVNETPIFESGPLVKKKSVPDDVRQALLSGEILIVAVEIEPYAAAACVESYIQAVAFCTDGRLPVANDRIG